MIPWFLAPKLAYEDTPGICLSEMPFGPKALAQSSNRDHKKERKTYLDTLAVARATLVNVFTSLVRSNKGDGLNVLVIADEVDSVLGSVNDVEDTGRNTGLLSKLSQNHSSTRVLLGGLEDAGVANDVGKREHPEGNHGREVEGGNTTDNTERLANGVGIHIGGDLEVITQQQVGDGTGRLNDLKTTENITTGIGQGLALLQSDRVSNPVHVVTDQELKVEHLALAVKDRGFLPGLEGLSGRVGSILELLRGSLGDQGNNLLGGLMEWMKAMLVVKKRG